MNQEEIVEYWINASDSDYKNQFYKIATAEYTEKYLLQAEQFIIWLKKYFQKK